MLAWLDKVLPFPHFEDEDRTYRGRVLMLLLRIVFVAGIVGVIVAGLGQQGTDRILVLGAAVVLVGLLMWMVSRGAIDIPSYAAPLLLILVFTYLAYTGRGIGDYIASGMFIAIALAALLLGRQGIVVFEIIVALAYGFLFWGQRTGLIMRQSTPAEFDDISAILLLYLITGAFLYVLIGNLTQARDRARESEAKLRKLNEELELRVQLRTREVEAARREAEDARGVAERSNEIKSRFLANMSHELRTPLNAIINFTTFVYDGLMGDINEEQQETLGQAIMSSKHLLALINDVLDMTKIEAGMMDLFIEQVDFNEILTATASVGKGLVTEKPIKLHVEIEENLPRSYGDKRRIRQVMLNMMSNAVKFTREGTVSLRARRDGGGVLITVQDSGVGIRPEDRDKVFESFRQAKHDELNAPGTGLGMPISKYFVESHGGRIWFESEPSRGTSFFVYLPVLTEERAEMFARAVAQPGAAQ